MKTCALELLLVAALLGSGCEKIRSLSDAVGKKPAPAGQHSATQKAQSGKKPAEAKAPLPFPKERAEAILEKQEKISTETRDAFLARQLSKSEEDDLYFEPPADESWSKLTPERR